MSCGCSGNCRSKDKIKYHSKLEMMNPKTLEWEVVCCIGEDFANEEFLLDQGIYRIAPYNKDDQI